MVFPKTHLQHLKAEDIMKSNLQIVLMFIFISLAVISSGCDSQTPIDAPPTNLIANDALYQKIAELESQLKDDESIEITYTQSPKSELNFPTIGDFEAFKVLRILEHLVEDKPIFVHESLKPYEGNLLGIEPVELSFFSNENNITVGEYRYSLVGDEMYKQNLTTGEEESLLPLINDTANKTMDDPDQDWPEFGPVTYNSTYHYGYFYLENWAYTTWYGSKKARAKTKIRLCVVGQQGKNCSAFDPSPGLFPQSPSVLARVFYKDGGGCPSKSASDSGTWSAQIDKSRCGNTGAQSEHYGEINGYEYLGGYYVP